MTTPDMKKPTVSLSAYLSLLLTIAFVTASFWVVLPDAFKWAICLVLVAALISQLTGVKKVGGEEVVNIIKDSIAFAKGVYPNQPQRVLDHVEEGLVFLSRVWARVNEFYQDVFKNTDGKRDGKVTQPPSPPETVDQADKPA